MADDKAIPQGAASAQELPIHLAAQYVRDISFENPGAPDSLRLASVQPQMDVNIGLDARKLPDSENSYEVVLSVRAEAVAQEKTMFLCEIQYGIVAEIDKSVETDMHHPLVFIEVPRQAFPFVRQIMATTVANGGFPPLYLSPVDFHQLYLERFKDDINASKKPDLAKAEAEGSA